MRQQAGLGWGETQQFHCARVWLNTVLDSDSHGFNVLHMGAHIQGQIELTEVSKFIGFKVRRGHFDHLFCGASILTSCVTVARQFHPQITASSIKLCLHSPGHDLTHRVSLSVLGQAKFVTTPEFLTGFSLKLIETMCQVVFYENLQTGSCLLKAQKGL